MNWKNLGKDKVDCVYVYKFSSDKTIYIGRTIDRDRRNLDHHLGKRDPIKKYIDSNLLEWPPMEIIEDNLTIKEGQEREIYWIEYYRSQGWNLLNIAKGGGLGALGHGKWNYKTCKEAASKYKNRWEFMQNERGAYNVCLKERWLGEFFPITKKRENYKIDQFDLDGNYLNTYNNISEAAKNTGCCSTSIGKTCLGLQRKSGNYLWRHHVNDKVCLIYSYIFEDLKSIFINYITDINILNRWQEEGVSKDTCLYKFIDKNSVDLPKYTILEEFLTSNESIDRTYYWINKYQLSGWNIINNLTPEQRWNHDLCKILSKQYKNAKDFCNSNRPAYEISRINGWLSEFFDKSRFFKKVDKLDMNGNYICTFNSITRAANSINKNKSSIINVCAGRINSSGGFKWRYHKEEDE